MANKSHAARIWLILPLLGLYLIIAGFLNYNSVHSASYDGLQTVACLDPTRPLTQDFSFVMRITLSGQSLLLAPNIGHDFGNCLHEIHTNDTSGKVLVQSNDLNPLTLGQFFDVWKMTFNDQQIGDHAVSGDHTLKVISHGGIYTNNLRGVELRPDEVITIIYQ